MIPRDLALAVLNSLGHSPGFSERYLERAFQKHPDLSERDRAFTLHLVQGVLRWRLRLDWIIEQAVLFPFQRIETPILNVLRIALYQIFFMDRVPESAAVNEAVKQTKSIGQRHVSGFVNGILRNICRQKDQIVFPDRSNDLLSYLSVFYSYPTWLVEKWIREVGIDSVEPLLAAGNRVPDSVIRANTKDVARRDLIECLKEEAVTGRPTPYSPEGINVYGLHGPVNKLNAFRQGKFQVQGEAAQVCSHLLSPRSGDCVLDVCAGLGGKSTHMAQLMRDKGRILALDIKHNRLVSLAQNSRRLGIGCILPTVADAGGRLSSLLDCSFDKILIDGPCSALGIISSHPDSKWARDEDHIFRLASLQKRILNEAVQLLRKGGKLLYVTCTISQEENEDVVRDFLERNREMVLEDLKDHGPQWALDLIDDQGFFRTLPHVHGMEGFFGALFKKE